MDSWFRQLVSKFNNVDVDAKTNTMLSKPLKPTGKDEEVVGVIDEDTIRLIAIHKECCDQLKSFDQKYTEAARNDPSIRMEDLDSMAWEMGLLTERVELLSSIVWHNIKNAISDLHPSVKNVYKPPTYSLGIRQGWQIVIEKNSNDEPADIEFDLAELLGPIDDFIVEGPSGIILIIKDGFAN